MVIYDYKAIDYINFILRAGDIAECPPEKVSLEVNLCILKPRLNLQCVYTRLSA